MATVTWTSRTDLGSWRSAARAAVAAIALLAWSGAAPAAPLTVATRVGGFNADGYGGSYGFVYGPGQNGKPGNGIFGADFGGTALVDSITIDQYDDAARRRPQNVRVYTDATTYITATFADTQGPQTVDLKPFNGGQPVRADSYLEFVVETEYGAGDPNFGVMDYSFDGTYVGPATANLNAGATPSVQNPLPGYGFGARTVDGQIVSHNTNDACFWTRDTTGPDALTVTYAGAKDVGSIGLGFAGDGPSRDMPKYVVLSDGNGHSEQITINLLPSQYMRYDLTTPFLGATYLTITMPPATGTGADSADWFINGDANYGITEFQAFAFVPEPASVGLVALGAGLLLQRRRSGCAR